MEGSARETTNKKFLLFLSSSVVYYNPFHIFQ